MGPASRNRVHQHRVPVADEADHRLELRTIEILPGSLVLEHPIQHDAVKLPDRALGARPSWTAYSSLSCYAQQAVEGSFPRSPPSKSNNEAMIKPPRYACVCTERVDL